MLKGNQAPIFGSAVGVILLVSAQLTAAGSSFASSICFLPLLLAIASLYVWGHLLRKCIGGFEAQGFFLHVGLGSLFLYAVLSGLSFLLQLNPVPRGQFWFLVPALLCLAPFCLIGQSCRKRISLDLKSSNSYLIFVAACVGYTIWSAHSHFLGPTGHDTTQHIHWMNSIKLEGFRSWAARGTDVLSAYPKGFHVWAALWGGFIPWEFGGALIKTLPALYSVFGIALLIEQVFLYRRKLDFPLLLLPAVAFVILVTVVLQLNHNAYQESTGRIASFFLIVLSLLLSSPFFKAGFYSRIILVLTALLQLLFFNPGNLVFFPAVLVLFFWSIYRIGLSSRRPISAVLIGGSIVLGTALEPYYLASVLKTFPSVAAQLESWLSLRFPWSVPNFATAASSLPGLETAARSFAVDFDRFINPFLKIRGLMDLAFPSAKAPILKFSGFLIFPAAAFLLVFPHRFWKIWGKLLLAAWGSLLVSALFLCLLVQWVSTENHVRLLLQYGRDSYSYFGFLFWATVFCSLGFAEAYRMTWVKNLRMGGMRLVASTLLLVLVPILSYGSQWTFQIHRSLERLGRVSMDDLRDLEQAEAFLEGKDTLLANCHLPPESVLRSPEGKELWMTSFAPSSLVSMARGSNFLCHYFLGRSITNPIEQLSEICAGNWDKPLYLLSWGEGYKSPLSNCAASIPFGGAPLRQFGSVSVFLIEAR